MNNYCVTCKFCDHSEGHICTLGRLPIDNPYFDSCESYADQKEVPYSIGIDLASKPDVNCRICPNCQRSVNYDDMIWLNGKCTCPQCYIKRRAQLDAQEKEDKRCGDCANYRYFVGEAWCDIDEKSYPNACDKFTPESEEEVNTDGQ